MFEINKKKFIPPAINNNTLFQLAKKERRAIAITELALSVEGSNKERTKRTERFRHGPFVKLGKQARSIFVGSANPEIFGSSAAIASLAQAHCLAAIPRDGFFSNVERQVALAKNVFIWLKKGPALTQVENEDKQKLLKLWQRNIMGVVEADPNKAVKRTAALYKAGVRTFRVYSPEPGTGPLETISKLRALEKKQRWKSIEIFSGQVVSIKQAQQLEKAGADGLFVGIGGGGRCITGVRSGAAIDWPQLVWKLRGKINIPVIVEGGASDHIAQTLAVGATGIGVTRAAGGGTIESPGGASFLLDQSGEIFKIYGGEASARVKYMGGREGPFETIPYVEGESTTVTLDYGRGNFPTILQKLFLLFGDAILAMVFQNQDSIHNLQKSGAKNLRLVTPTESILRNTH